MEDDVVAALYQQLETVGQDIKAKESMLRRYEDASRSLFEVLSKSEPVDLKQHEYWGNLNSTSTQVNFTLPIACRAGWISCPLRTSVPWAYMVNDKIIIGVEVENLHFDKCIADISGTILAVFEGRMDWIQTCRSYLLTFDQDEPIYPRETNCLKPLQKAKLVVCACAPSTLLSSELILIGQASVREMSYGNGCQLPPAIEPHLWQYWNGELGRIPNYYLDPSGTSLKTVKSCVETFTRDQMARNDVPSCQQLLASIYACQEHKAFRVPLEEVEHMDIGHKNMKLANCWSSRDEAKYCQIPLFDGILLFRSIAHQNNRILVTGWTSAQIDQFIQYWGTPLEEDNAQNDEEDEKQKYASSKTKDSLFDCLSKMESTGITGDRYRELRMEMCAADVLRMM